MGWRWRKTKTLGGFRTTFSKKGVGYSYGIPGLRFGVCPDARKYFSCGFPGTGFYYIKYFKKQVKKQKSTVQKTQLPKKEAINVDINSISKKF